MGKKKVAIDAPIRLIAAAIPTPVLRKRVSNITGGYTYWMFVDAVKMTVNSPKRMKANRAGMLVHKPRMSKNAAVAVNVEITKERRDIAHNNQTPRAAPSSWRPLT